MEPVLDGLISIVALVVLACYAWSTRSHFVSDSMTPGASLIAGSVVVSGVLFLFLTWYETQPLAAQIVGLLIQLFSLALFFAAIRASRAARLRFVFDPEQPHSLVTEGPYGLVRHPFYVSYSIFWIGWAIATWSAWSLISLALLLTLYVRAAMMEERNFAASPLAEDYAAYRQRVGFFVPWLR